MYKTIAEFVDDWTKESAITLKVLRALTDASLKQKSDPAGNTLGKLSWDMAVMLGVTGTAVGLEVAAPARGTEPPNSAKSMADSYQTAAHSFGEQASTKLKDEQLSSEITYFGRSLTRASALQGLIRHQVHHRGQMTILMREAGLVVPSVYGPSREESAAMRAKQASK